MEPAPMLLGALGLIVIAAIHGLFAKALLHQVGERRASLVAALGGALVMAGATWLGRITQDMVWAVVGSGLIAAIGVALLWTRGPPSLAPEGSADLKRPIPWGFHVLHAALFVLVVDACLEGYWWDEFSAHYGLTSVLAHGHFPPEFPIYPGEPFKYHYGFDVLAGAIRAFSGVSSATALDIVSMLTFGVLMLLARDAGRGLAGPWGAGLAPLLVPLGSGTLQFLLFPDLGPLELRSPWVPMELARSMPPPVISNFFQHPQGLGMTLALAVVLLASGDHLGRRRMAAAALLLGLSSLAHVVFFGVLGLALGGAVILRRTRALRERAIELVFLALALALAPSLGGFFHRSTAPVESMLVWGSHFEGTWSELAFKHFVMFGVPLLAFPFVFLRVLRKRDFARVTLLLGTVLGFTIPALLRYERSWDMVKLYGAGAFFLNLLFADLIAGVLLSRGSVLSPGPLLRRTTAAVLIALSIVTGLHFLVRMGPLDGRLGVPDMHFPPPSFVAERAGDALHRRMEDPRAPVLIFGWLDGVSAGLIAPGHNWRVVGGAWLLNRGELDRRHVIFRRAQRDLNPSDLDALGIRYLLLHPFQVSQLSSEGRRRLTTNFERLEELQEAGARMTIYRRRF